MIHLKPVAAHGPQHDTPTECRNCGTAVADKFCPSCGQETALHVPSAGEFLQEFIGHMVALEGKLWKTLAMLARPGRLTADYLSGRRVPYIQPLRLYLTMSLVFFALLKICGITLPQLSINDHLIAFQYKQDFGFNPLTGKQRSIALSFNVNDPNGASASAADPAAAQPNFYVEQPSNLSIQKIFASIAKVSPAWKRNLDDFMRLPDQRKSEMLNGGCMEYLPYMLIATLPLFACYLKLIYLRTGRRYGEHLVFALHSNTPTHSWWRACS